MLKILQARLQQFVNHWLPDVQAGFRKGRGTRNQLLTSVGSLKKQEFQKNTYHCFIDYIKTFDCGPQQTGKFLKRQEYQATSLASWVTCIQVKKQQLVRSRHGTTDCFQTGKGVCQSCILSPCLFNSYAEDIMRNARLYEAQAGIKIAGRNINNSDMQMIPL